MARLIQEGDQVLLKRDDNSGVFQVKRNRQFHFDKAKFTLDGLIGHPFGATFKVEKGAMIRIDDPDKVLNELMETESSAAVRGKDNRDLVAAGSNQKLSQDDILKMKEEGKKGEEIIQELITNSETFENKTEYSQRKYLRKKMKKHIFIFTALKPTARLLIGMVYTKSPEKISHLRIDSLSQILQYANIMAGINVAIVDTLQGLVVGSVMERMGGMGKVVQFYPGSDLNRHVLNFFDFPSEFKDNLYNFGLKNLPELKTHGQESVRDMKIDTKEKGDNSGEKDGDSSDNGAPTQVSLTKTDCSQAGEKRKGDNSGEKDCDSSGQERAECLDIKMATAEKGDNSVEKACDSNNSAPSQDSRTKADGIQTGEKRKGDNSEKVEKRLEKARIQDYVKTLILQKDFDCLIVACKHHPTPIVLALLEYVGPSRPVVVYSSYKEIVRPPLSSSGRASARRVEGLGFDPQQTLKDGSDGLLQLCEGARWRAESQTDRDMVPGVSGTPSSHSPHHADDRDWRIPTDIHNCQQLREHQEDIAAITHLNRRDYRERCSLARGG